MKKRVKITAAERQELIARWQEDVLVQDGCWGWTGSRFSNGYARVLTGKGRKQIGGHRVSYELHHRRLKPTEHVLHSCDNPICTNPTHLRAGSDRENSRECHSKDRNRNRRTTYAQRVYYMNEIRAGRMLRADAARAAGVSKTAVTNWFKWSDR